MMFKNPKAPEAKNISPVDAEAIQGNGNNPANMDKPPTAPPETPSELERLREILYGTQNRTNEQRLSQLESRQGAMQKELTTLINDRLSALADSFTAQINELRRDLMGSLNQQHTDHTSALQSTKKELVERFDRQDGEISEKLRTTNLHLGERIDHLATDAITQLRSVQKELTEKIDRNISDQVERTRNLQNETRQRDESLRTELTALEESLDGRKVSRQDLGQMLAEIAIRLQAKHD